MKNYLFSIGGIIILMILVYGGLLFILNKMYFWGYVWSVGAWFVIYILGINHLNYLDSSHNTSYRNKGDEKNG